MRASELPASPSRNVLTIGMAPATAASKLSATPFLLGKRRQRDAVPGEQRLVGGDHRFAGRERGRDRGLGGIALAAHQLDEHVDLGIGRERDRIGHPAQLPAARCRASCCASAR